jgi:hypothetical protein
MKHLFTLLFIAMSYAGFAQVTPTTPPAGTKLTGTSQFYLHQSGGITRAFARWAAPGITAAYYEIGAGGSGTIDTTRLMYLEKNQTSTGFKSFTGRASVSNSGNLTGNALDVFSNSSSLSAIEANNGAGGLAIKAITTNASAFETTNVSAASPSGKFINLSSGPHAQFGSTTGKIATVTNSGNIITPKASASNHVVIKSQLDSVGALINTTDNYRTISDFYNQVILTGTTTPDTLYADTIPGGTLANNGDKLVAYYSGLFQTALPTDAAVFKIHFGPFVASTTIAKSVTGTLMPFVVKSTMIRTGSSTVKATTEFTYENQNDSGGIVTKSVTQYFTGTTGSLASNIMMNFIGELDNSASSIRAEMGYIEFKPAAL